MNTGKRDKNRIREVKKKELRGLSFSFHPLTESPSIDKDRAII